jgi:hypothetical protein
MRSLQRLRERLLEGVVEGRRASRPAEWKTNPWLYSGWLKELGREELELEARQEHLKKTNREYE